MVFMFSIFPFIVSSSICTQENVAPAWASFCRVMCWFFWFCAMWCSVSKLGNRAMKCWMWWLFFLRLISSSHLFSFTCGVELMGLSKSM